LLVVRHPDQPTLDPKRPRSQSSADPASKTLRFTTLPLKHCNSVRKHFVYEIFFLTHATAHKSAPGNIAAMVGGRSLALHFRGSVLTSDFLTLKSLTKFRRAQVQSPLLDRSLPPRPPGLPATPNTNRKPIEKCNFQNQYSLLFVTRGSEGLGVFPLRFTRGSDRTTQFCRLSAIFSFPRQNSRSVIPRPDPHSCNPIAKTEFFRGRSRVHFQRRRSRSSPSLPPS